MFASCADRLIAARALQVWWLVPQRHKFALVGSALLMVVTSLCCTLIPLQLGRLLDQIGLGGMGVIYKAEDVKRIRFVGLNFPARRCQTREIVGT